MASAITCSLCNRPLSINNTDVDTFYFIEATSTQKSNLLRGKKNFRLKLCSDCMEKVLLEPMDKAEEDFKKCLYGGCCDCE